MCVLQCPFSPLCMHRTCILSRRQAYKRTQDRRLSSKGSGGRARRSITAVCCVGDSRTPRPARSLPISGPLAAVGGVVTVSGRLPVTVPRPGDRPGSLARGCYEPSLRQRRLRCWRFGGDGLSSPPGLGLGRVGVGPLILAPILLEHSFENYGCEG